MTAIKDLVDLISKLKTEIKDHDDFERFRQVRQLAETVEDDNSSLKRENTALHEQLALSKVNNREMALQKEEENATLRIEIRYLKEELRSVQKLQAQCSSTTFTISPVEPVTRIENRQSDTQLQLTTDQIMVSPNSAALEKKIDQPLALSANLSEPTSSEILKSFWAAALRQSIIAIRQELLSKQAKTMNRSEILTLIENANQNRPIDVDRAFESILTHELLKRAYGDRFELTAKAYTY